MLQILGDEANQRLKPSRARTLSAEVTLNNSSGSAQYLRIGRFVPSSSWPYGAPVESTPVSTSEGNLFDLAGVCW
jgi:hypothetical protein